MFLGKAVIERQIMKIGKRLIKEVSDPLVSSIQAYFSKSIPRITPDNSALFQVDFQPIL